MKTLAAFILAASIALTSATAYAGGPVVVAEEPEVTAETPRSGWIVPVIVGGILLCAIACGGSDNN